MPIETIGENSTDDYSGLEDTFLYEGQATSNFDTDVNFKAQKPASGQHANELVRATGLSNISASATVSAATFYAYLHFSSITETDTVQRLLRDWVTDEATWTVYSTGNSWTSGGGISDGNDRSATTSASASIGSPTGYKSWSAAQLITDVQNFIDGTWTNNGWIFERTDGTDDGEACEFDSSEASDGNRPYLEVNYSTGATYDSILKRWNGSAWVKAKLVEYDGADWVATDWNYYDGGWKSIDTTGV